MARKLTPKEIKRAKADFDPPRWKVPPGQTSLFEEKEEGANRKTGKPAGRPRKHDEKGRSVSFWLTESAIRKLRTEAAARGMTAPDLLHKMIEAL